MRKFGERCGKVCWSVGEEGEMWRSVEKCVGVWGRCGEVQNVESVWRETWESVGRGEEKCMGMNVKSVAKCVRVWGEVLVGVGEGVGKCVGVRGEMRRDVESVLGCGEALGEGWESGESTGRDVGKGVGSVWG